MIKVDIPNKEIESLTKKLLKYGEDQSKKLKDNLNEAGINIESGAKEKITSDGHIDTGRLRSSIHYESSTVNNSFRYSDDGGNSFDGSLGVDPSEFEVYVGTNVDYAESVRQIDDFLFPPAEAERADLIKRLKKQLRDV
jgi:hypothetical protein